MWCGSTGISASAPWGRGSNIDLLEKQIREFRPGLAAVWEEEKARELKSRVRDTNTKIVSGMDGLLELAGAAGGGAAGDGHCGNDRIRPTMAALEAGKDIALANKETLVTAGHLITELAKKTGAKILPVDSEHSAIFQCLHGENPREVSRLLITASGGPFRGYKRKQLEKVQVEDALKHPNWSMGPKITVDSATLVNKGLEVMEARWLFGVRLEQIQVLVQPRSVIHSMVEFRDGAVLAQLGAPDMRLPIQYALYYPERPYLTGERLDFEKLAEITFERPDTETFQGLPLALKAAAAGGSVPTVFNAANEKAVELFLKRKIGFLDIYDIIGLAMEHHKRIEHPNLQQILDTEAETYDWIESRW